MEGKAIVKGVTTAALFTLAKGENSSLNIPLIGSYSTPIAGFAHGFINSYLTDNVYPYARDTIVSVYKPENAQNIVSLQRATRASVSAAGQYLLTYGQEDATTSLLVGALADFVRY